MAALSKIFHPDPVINRIQDQLIATVNPLAKSFQALKVQPVVSGSKGGNAALTSLISALAQLGLVKDQTT